MRLGAYQDVPAFAYPGWRLSVPGGPAGGHYKGFTHTEATGTDLPPQDPYEQDREDGMSSHDTVHTSDRNPRGVYRSSGEVPPRPNASGAAHTYRGMQTARHPGTSEAPGSFPAEFIETLEDVFLSGGLGDLGWQMYQDGGAMALANGGGRVVLPGPAQTWRPNVAVCSQLMHAAPPPGYAWETTGTSADGCPIVSLVPTAPPQTGATSVVNQPPASPAPLPPSPSVPVYTAPPVSPAPAPVVNTNQVVPLNDGSGNYVNVSTGQTVPASAVTQNLATMQLTAAPSTDIVSTSLAWLEQPSALWAAVPNWGLLAGAALVASMLMGGHKR
jgi:hypothetical protein